VLFDSHNHLQSSKFGKNPPELIAEMRAAGIAGCVANATREDDWEAVAALARELQPA
jgi:Tat protein secretion system quality control protein TatD with DNase activity